jgi:hypothetical protein
VIARTLFRRIVLRTEDAEVHRALRYLECAPDIEGEAPREVEFRIERHRGYYHVFEDGRPLLDQLTADGIVQYLHRRLFVLAIEERDDALLLHAASLRKGERRLILVGTEGAGKTTLTLRLMLAGYEIEGDENIFIDARGVIARPRGMRVKERGLAHLPEIAAVIAQAPCMVNLHGQKIFNLDPRALGARWHIRRGTADLLLLMHANHGGASSIRRLAPLQAGREILAEIGFPPTGRGRAVAALASLTARARAFDLSLGEPAQAIALIDRLLEQDDASPGPARA